MAAASDDIPRDWGRLSKGVHDKIGVFRNLQAGMRPEKVQSYVGLPTRSSNKGQHAELYVLKDGVIVWLLYTNYELWHGFYERELEDGDKSEAVSFSWSDSSRVTDQLWQQSKHE